MHLSTKLSVASLDCILRSNSSEHEQVHWDLRRTMRKLADHLFRDRRSPYAGRPHARYSFQADIRPIQTKIQTIMTVMRRRAMMAGGTMMWTPTCCRRCWHTAAATLFTLGSESIGRHLWVSKNYCEGTTSSELNHLPAIVLEPCRLHRHHILAEGGSNGNCGLPSDEEDEDLIFTGSDAEL